jgi:hypothetical protein
LSEIVIKTEFRLEIEEHSCGEPWNVIAALARLTEALNGYFTDEAVVTSMSGCLVK